MNVVSRMFHHAGQALLELCGDTRQDWPHTHSPNRQPATIDDADGRGSAAGAADPPVGGAVTEVGTTSVVVVDP